MKIENLDVNSSNLSCDRLVPFTNETTVDLQNSINNCLSDKGLYSDIVCPHCGAKHFTIGLSFCTAVYYPPVYKDGVNMNLGQNTVTTNYQCLNCNKFWTEES